jgi:Ca2+-binding RTX toxin-like protein
MAESGLNLLEMIAADTMSLRKATNAITTSGPDTEYGNGGDNTIRGMGGDDTLGGRGGKDRLFGDADDDFLFGGAGKDKLFGGTGDDTLIGDGGSDRFYGGTGNDRLELDGGKDKVYYDVADGNQGRDLVLDFDIGTDKIFLVGYEPSASALSLLSTNGGTNVTLTETGQVIFLDIAFGTVASNASEIFQIV